MTWKLLNGSLALVLVVACGGSTSGNGSGGSAGTGGYGGFGGFGGAAASGGSGAGSGAGGTGGVGATGGSGGVGATGGSGGVGAGGTGGATGGSGGVGATGGTGGATQGPDCTQTACITPPPPSSQPPNTNGGTTIIAISHLFLGDTDRQGNASATAWKSFGYNLDGLVSAKTDTNHCRLVTGANPANVKTDGAGGIDNSFGSNILTLITSLSPTASDDLNMSIANGVFTEMFKVENLVDPAQAPNQNGVQALFYAGADKGSPAAFDGTDVWPVTYESVNGGNVNSPKVVFPNSYVSGGMWVSGGKGSIILPFGVSGYDMQLPITGAVMSMHIQGTGSGAAALDGTIAGVINTEAFIAELKKVAGSFDPTLCSGSTFDSIAQQIRQASDIMSDGSNGDPTTTCDGISIGLGFNGRAVQLGAVAAPVVPPPDPCAP